MKNSKNNDSWSPWLKWTVLVLIGLGLIWLAFRGQDLDGIAMHLAGTNWVWIGLSLSMTLLGHLSRARRWQLLVAATGYRVSLRDSFVSMMTGYLSNLGIPRVGEVGRCASLQQLSGAPIFALGGTVVAERAVDLVTFALLLGLTVGLAGGVAAEFVGEHLWKPLIAVLGWKLWVVLGVGIVGLGMLYLFAFSGRAGERAWVAWLRNAALGIWAGLVSAFRLERGPRLEFLLHTLVIWVVYYSAPYCTMAALGLADGATWYIAFHVFVFGSLARTIPLPAGSAGAYHYIVMQLLMAFGYTELEGLTVATLNHAVQTLFQLVVGALAMGAFVYLRSVRHSKD